MRAPRAVLFGARLRRRFRLIHAGLRGSDYCAVGSRDEHAGVHRLTVVSAVARRQPGEAEG